MEYLTTGQVAKQAQVNIETVRYYERRELIQEPPRRESGYRQYPRDMVARTIWRRIPNWMSGMYYEILFIW